MKLKRLLGLDIFRIILAVMTLAFHSKLNFGCDYGFLNNFVSMGAVAMTGFFMLSGYSNYYVYENKTMCDITEIKKFYKKKAVALFPAYYIICLLYFFIGKESLLDNIILAPMEFLGIQSAFPSTFGLTHNGGTWFISCVLLAYILFPYLTELMKQMRLSGRISVMLLLMAVLLYAPLSVLRFELGSIYANPFFRILEFMIGMLLASLKPKMEKCKFFSFIFNKVIIVIEWLIMIFGITILYNLNVYRDNYMLYSWVCLPIFMLILVSMSGAKWNGKYVLSKLLLYLSEISYAFFLVQLFIWPIMKKIVSFLKIESNLLRIVSSFVFCTAIAIVIHEFAERPFKKLLMNKRAD